MHKDEQWTLTSRQKRNLELECLSCGWIGRGYQLVQDGSAKCCPECGRVAFESEIDKYLKED